MDRTVLKYAFVYLHGEEYEATRPHLEHNRNSLDQGQELLPSQYVHLSQD